MDLCRSVSCCLFHVSIFHPCEYLYSQTSSTVTLLPTLIWPPFHYITQTALAKVTNSLYIEKFKENLIRLFSRL